MQRFYRVEYRRGKNDNAGTLIERIAGAVEASGSAQHPVSFSFTEPFIPGARSTLDYLIKSFPIFESYRSETKGRARLSGTYVTDIPADSSKRPPVPVSTLIEVARGIPRRFNFGNASFIWQNVRALDLQPDAPQPDSSAAGLHGRLIGRFGDPGIYVTSAWGASKRTLDVIAIARLHPNGRVTKKPQLPDAMQQLLEGIGRIKTGDVFSLPNAGEPAMQTKERLMEIEDVFKRARDAFRARLASLPLEQIRFPERGEFIPENPGSVKEPAARALAALSYAPLPAAGVRGALVFGKSVDAGRELRITIDTGTWSHHFHARFEIRSEQWIRSMAIPLSATFPEGHYRQIDAEHIERLCTNLGIVVRELEADVYPPIAQALDRISAS